MLTNVNPEIQIQSKMIKYPLRHIVTRYYIQDMIENISARRITIIVPLSKKRLFIIIINIIIHSI